MAQAASKQTLGVIGLGNMGFPLATNLVHAGFPIVCHDTQPHTMQRLQALSPETVTPAPQVHHVAEKADTLITVLPNDAILKEVTHQGILPHLRPGSLHIGCSTVSPDTSNQLAQAHTERSTDYVAAPIFARPDGMAALQAHFVVSGTDPDARRRAQTLLHHTAANVHEISGNNPGAANVVKLCGNFLIASAIESISEALAVVEGHGLDRTKVMELYSSTFLDCVIYQGYGARVAARNHTPGGFALKHGLKDLRLAQSVAQATATPTPVLSVLVDRFVSETAKGRQDLDWSAIGLGVSEAAGKDVSSSVLEARKTKEDNKSSS